MTIKNMIIPWWERDEELKKIAEKYDNSSQNESKEISCCCQDEGVEMATYYICPVHPPQSLTHMRAIIKFREKEAYIRGIEHAYSKMRDKMKEIWEERYK